MTPFTPGRFPFLCNHDMDIRFSRDCYAGARKHSGSISGRGGLNLVLRDFIISDYEFRISSLATVIYLREV